MDMRPEPVRLFHLWFLAPLLLAPVIIVLGILGAFGIPITWWQVAIVLIGAEVWSFGWHAWAHHRHQWIAHWSLRAAGFGIAVAGTVFQLFISFL